MFSGSLKVSRHPIVTEDLRRIGSQELPWSELSGATVLVTGASGLVPAYLVEALLYLNETEHLSKPLQVIGLVRNEQKAAARFAAYQGRSDLEFLVQDVSEPLQFCGAVDYVVHAASQARPRYFEADPVGTFKPNVIGTYQLLEHARIAGTRRLLFVSSGEVYGKFGTSPSVAITEDHYGALDPLALRSCYGESKRAGEAMCAAWSHQHGVHTSVARLGHTYGPGMDLEDGRVFADFVANVVRGENIVLKSDGSTSRPFCYLADATIGMLTLLLRGQSGAAYNLVNDEAEIRIADLAEMICRLFPEKNLRVIKPAQESTSLQQVWNRGQAVNTSKIRALGWRPSTSVEEGFRRTIEYYLN